MKRFKLLLFTTALVCLVGCQGKPMVTTAEPDYAKAYKEILEYEQERLADCLTSEEPSDEYEETIDCYWVYDIDKDGIPELLIRYGHCEAAYHGKLYTYADEKAQLISDGLGMSHTSFYAVPGENGILSYWGHMGVGYCEKLTLNNGDLDREELYSEDINEKLYAGEDVWYKKASEIVEGAYYLEEYSIDNTYPIDMYEKVAEYSSGKGLPEPTEYSFPDNNPDFYTDFMENDEIVNAVALDRYMNTLGEVPFSRLLDDDQIYEYTFEELVAHGITYADLNADGIYECIFYISDGDDLNKDFCVILSLQEGKMYAYLKSYPTEAMITEDGYFITEPGEYIHDYYYRRVLYDKEQCFTYTVGNVP